MTHGPKDQWSEANKKLWDDCVAEFAVKNKDNPSQINVFQSPSRMRSRIVAVRGPPGTGKTRTLKSMIVTMAKIKHRILCVAAANAAVDLDATAVFQAYRAEGDQASPSRN